MPEKNDGSQAVEPVADLSNPRETQSILAYILTIGFLLVIGYAVAKASTFQDIATVLGSLSPLATMVLAFYFANKAAQQAQAAASA
jgi:positive regulator of sigma E activity